MMLCCVVVHTTSSSSDKESFDRKSERVSEERQKHNPVKKVSHKHTKVDIVERMQVIVTPGSPQVRFEVLSTIWPKRINSQPAQLKKKKLLTVSL